MTTAPPSTEFPAADGRPAIRHPVQVDIDGDFALDDLLTLPDTAPPWTISAAQATRAGLWRPATATVAELRSDAQRDTPTIPDRPTDADIALLRRLETGNLFRPPVHEQLTPLTAEVAAAWLALAAYWIGLAQSSPDLRFLNAACKLTGAAWLHHKRTESSGRCPDLIRQLAALGRLLAEATDQLRRRLARRLVLAGPSSEDDVIHPVSLASPNSGPRIVVLADSRSRSARRLLTTATAMGLPLKAVCWYAARDTTPASSNYSSAWYPAGPLTVAPDPGLPTSVPATAANSWDDVTAALRAVGTDLALLVGMPIVPAAVLDAAKFGFLNAHNGALPSHRGMDAVGWALIQNQPIVCSLHLARPAVDRGEVISAHPVPAAPARTLAARVKTTQLRLLLAGAAHVAATGTLPDLMPQPTSGTQFYRLHPHLKRLLDASPYANDDHPQQTVIQS